jgi:hypothetical protein
MRSWQILPVGLASTGIVTSEPWRELQFTVQPFRVARVPPLDRFLNSAHFRTRADFPFLIV